MLHLRAQWRRLAATGPIYVRLPKDPPAAHQILLSYLDSGHESGKGFTAPKEPWSRDVLHELTHEGGFSFHDHTGDGPTTGHMVSMDPANEEVHPLRDLQHRPEIVGDYVDRHHAELADPANHLGGWVHRGKVFLDISTHTDSAKEAEHLARRFNQKAYYNLDSGQSVYVDKQAA